MKIYLSFKTIYSYEICQENNLVKNTLYFIKVENFLILLQNVFARQGEIVNDKMYYNYLC